MSSEQATDVIIYALHAGLGRNLPVRDIVLASLTPAQREEHWAVIGRHGERIAATNH